jgi:Fic family protein
LFTPKYKITPKLLNNLTKIERLYGQIEAEDIIPSIALRLQNENIVLSTHHSTSIEGNPLSPTEVTNVILGDKIPTNRAEKEVKDYFEALVKLDEYKRNNTKLNIELINKIHALTMRSAKDARVGEFRNSKVVVGHQELVKGAATIKVKHDPPAHTQREIKRMVKELIEWVNKEKNTQPILKASIFHHRFVYIHPFYDGNGRVTRLLTSYILMLNGYEVTRYFILDDYYDIDKLQYSDKLHSADKGNLTEWLEYFTEGLAYSLQAALGKIKEYKEDKLEDVKGEKRALVSKREEDVLRIIMELKAVRSSDIAKKLGVSRQQAFRLLDSLVEKRILKRFGKTKSSYYELTK